MTALDEMKLTTIRFVFFTADNGPEGPTDQKGRTRGSPADCGAASARFTKGAIRCGRNRALARAHSRRQNVRRADHRTAICSAPPAKSPHAATEMERVIDGCQHRSQLVRRKADRPGALLAVRYRAGPVKPRSRIGDWKIVAAEDMWPSNCTTCSTIRAKRRNCRPPSRRSSRDASSNSRSSTPRLKPKGRRGGKDKATQNKEEGQAGPKRSAKSKT